MQRSNSTLNQVSPYESLANKSERKKRKLDNFDNSLPYSNGSSLKTTCYPDYVKSCKDNFIAWKNIDKTG